MKRFILFTTEDYYPAGGVKDIAGSFDSFEELDLALVSSSDRYADEAQCLDTQDDRKRIRRRVEYSSKWEAWRDWEEA